MNSAAGALTHHSMMALVEPMKSDIFSTSAGHSGCEATNARGCSPRACTSLRAKKVECTMHAPCQIFMFSRPVCCFTQLPKLISGRNRIGVSRGTELTIFTALREVVHARGEHPRA